MLKNDNFCRDKENWNWAVSIKLWTEEQCCSVELAMRWKVQENLINPTPTNTGQGLGLWSFYYETFRIEQSKFCCTFEVHIHEFLAKRNTTFLFSCDILFFLLRHMAHWATSNLSRMWPPEIYDWQLQNNFVVWIMNRNIHVYIVSNIYSTKQHTYYICIPLYILSQYIH